MLPNPLHPAVVHFPVVFAVLLPLVAIGALALIARGAKARIAWALPALLAVALAVASYAAVQTGETQEDRVEAVVAKGPIHEHEEAAERFLLFSGLLALVALAGLARGNLGTAARSVATVGAVLVMVGGYQVGRSGGALVYEHGAAAAYTVGAGYTDDGYTDGASERADAIQVTIDGEIDGERDDPVDGERRDRTDREHDGG